MQTIYLDQMKWVDLARAESGHPQGAPFVDALEIFERAVADGRARFVLSAAHYLETGKRRERRSRTDVAETMMRLAGMNRIAPPHIIVPWEIRRALIEVFGLSAPLHPLELVGDGAAHAFAMPSLRYTAPPVFEGAMLPEALRRRLEADLAPEFEATILAGNMPDGYPDSVRLVFNDFIPLHPESFVGEQERIAGWVQELGRAKLPEVMAGTAMADIIDPLIATAAELGISMEDVAAARNVEPLIQQMPSRSVEAQLRSFRQANPQKRWEGNDLNDITALAIAVPYCDVVVTEKSWSSMLNAAKVPQRFGTVVTPVLQDAVDLLQSAG